MNFCNETANSSNYWHAKLHKNIPNPLHFSKGTFDQAGPFLSILNLCWWFFPPNFANFVQTTWNFNHINNVVTKIKYLRNKASKQVFIKLEAFKHWYLFLVILSFCKSDLHPEDEEVTKIWCEKLLNKNLMKMWKI